ncbi:flavin reductase family protein [Rhizobium sp. L1K21]|uniref:flavin reductase family protein n=1 Tax=Rhizobium sp. L1K21 TaxID=2954933 RepID=UPI0020930420|nr:flavin reductase family protein [Rhizobium sp. L1K21]MCO6186297.1 flavin reductase family protein [Rhizobium sp. L1K21]
MFYEEGNRPEILAHDPFKAIVSPRPIGWIGTKGEDGSINLAPYSFFAPLSDKPKLVMFSSTGRKDSLRNIEETGVFTCNLASHDLLHQMNASSAPAPYEFDEFGFAGLTAVPGKLVDAPYAAEAYAVLECRVVEIKPLKGLGGEASQNTMIIGQVVGTHIRDEAIRDGRLDMAKVRPLGRLGYFDYSESGDVFELMRPTWK